MALKAGSKAPLFKAVSDDSTEFSLEDFLRNQVNKFIVLYFYPKDNTSGCTKEACDFRDNMQRIASLDTFVIGISPDGTSSHLKFKNKFDLNFMLLSDDNREICEKYGVWVEKSMYGRKYMGVERTTFIINPKGVIEFVFEKVKVQGHVDAVIEKLNDLK